MSAARLLSRRDLDFLLYEWLKVEQLVERPRFKDHSRETFDAVLDTYAQFAAAQFAPLNKRCDCEPPQLVGGEVRVLPQQKHAYQGLAAAGMLAACHDAQMGGMQLPYVIERAGMAFLNAASISTAAYAFLTMANANLVRAHGSAEQIERFVKPMLEGRWTGTMCLSEPSAGSSLADITTRAQRQPDGSYRLFGNKMWISAGDHDLAQNIVHLVLAKVPDANGTLPAGTRGISLFIVPKFLDAGAVRNDVVVAGLNHKMGYRGTPNCLLNFGEGRYRPQARAGAIGELVGAEGQGLIYMFHMMNEARIGVGLGAAALGYTGYLHALEFARSRRQGRLPGQKDPALPPVRIIEHADVRRMLLAQKAWVEGALALVLYAAHLVDERDTGVKTERADAHRLLELLTPIAKSWPSKWALAANDLAIQVHGGYGYTQDFNVEQFYRDNRLNPIHEGTAGIQAIDLLGRKAGAEDGRARELLAGRILATLARALAQPQLHTHAIALRAAWERLEETTVALLGNADATARLANAGCYLDAFGHIVVAWLWLEQALTALPGVTGPETDFYRGKLAAGEYFLRWELPRIERWLGLLSPIERTPLDAQEAWFG
jgi:alkylation response protein AidB-like acyl-CoA dehydrogenase